MKICVLIQAEIGHTENVFIGKNKEELIEKISAYYDKEISTPSYFNDIGYNKRCYAALIAMVNNHTKWKVGKYELENIEPLWDEFTLTIEEI